MTGHSSQVNDIVEESIGILKPVFGKDARDEVLKVIADYLSTSPFKLLLEKDRLDVTPVQEKEISDRIRRRSDREPLQYISGFAYFMGEKFLVGPGVLIPRNDTEILVEEAVRITSGGTAGPVAFLEFCSGSGCIGLSFIKKMCALGFDAKGVATDISSEALSYAAKNARLLGCSGRIRLIQHDILAEPALLKSYHKSYRMILANPPYIKTQALSCLEPEVCRYEPHIALDGGPEGLTFYRRILEYSEALLSPGGWILLEIGYDQELEMTRLMQDSGLFDIITIRKDYGGNPRVAAGKRKNATGDDLHGE